MGNVNTIVEKVNGKKLLRELFILNSFFTFLFLVKPGSIVSEFITMQLGFFCSSRAEIMITRIVGNDYCSAGKCLSVLKYRLLDASAHSENITDKLS